MSYNPKFCSSARLITLLSNTPKFRIHVFDPSSIYLALPTSNNSDLPDTLAPTPEPLGYLIAAGPL